MREYEKPIVQIIDFATEEILMENEGEVGEGFSDVGDGTGNNPFG